MADVEAASLSYMVELSISVYLTKAGSAVIIYPERIGEETATKKAKRRDHSRKTWYENLLQESPHDAGDAAY